MNLYLVRHGETVANAEGLVCGQLNSPLNDRGMLQAKKLSAALETIAFDLHITTPLQRAYETAQLVYPAGKFIHVPELMETNTGDVSGWTVEKLIQHDARFSQHGLHHHLKYPNGESITDVFNRMVRWLQSFLIEKNDIENVLIVAHGGTVATFLHYLFEIPLRLYPAFMVDNASYTKISCNFKSQYHQLIKFNEVA